VGVANSTTEYWEVDGVSLNQYCWNISTLGGGRLALPPLRGDDIQYAYRPGRDWRAKTPDSRVISLAMWVVGIDPDTSLPGADQGTQWNENWRSLRNLFWTPRGQVALTRRVKYESGIQTTTALASLAGSMEPTMTGRTRANFVVDLLLSDPFFYGSSITVNVPRSTPTIVANPGDDVVAYRNFSLTFNGPLTNPKLTNATSDPDVWVKVGAAIASGDSVTLDVGEFTATRTSDSANLVGGVTHSGSRTWLGLIPGDNTLTLTSDSGTGTVDVTFAAPYL
jgi:Phage tail protein